MAWRIDEQVIHGEIDNRIRGRVTGRIWFAGRETPVELNLEGNAWRDLAGRRLQFVNPTPIAAEPLDLPDRHEGEVGDITASRKVKVPDVRGEEFRQRYRRREPIPWHWANSLYLEWYDELVGRVVIESASFTLTVDPEATWEMSAEEEEQQRALNAGALSRFMSRLSEELEAPLEEDIEPLDTSERGADAAPGDAAEGRPLSEAEAERLLEESDRLTDRVQARMEQEGPDADLGRIIGEEIDRARRERGEPEPTPEQEEERRQWIEEVNAAAEAAADDADERPDDFHPLSRQCRELTIQLIDTIERKHWLPPAAGPEHPVADLQSSLMKAGAKLAAALDRREWPPPREECATTIVWLRRSIRYFDDALLAGDACERDQLVERLWLADNLQDIRQLQEEVGELVVLLRALLARGFE